MCYAPSPIRAISFAPAPYGQPGAGVVALTVDQPLKSSDLNALSTSQSLFYSDIDRKVYMIDQLKPDDERELKFLAFYHNLDRSDVARAIRLRKGASCQVPASDRGITEAYWAGKGTAVLHHWSYLYDSSFSDGRPVHAQYGSLVSRVSRAIATSAHMAGPTGFVRTAWLVYLAVGCLYLAFYFSVFRGNLLIAAVGAAWQFSTFASIGLFSIILAPGYHWSRELAMILAPVCIALWSRSGIGRLAMSIVLVLGMAGLGYALDPTFVLIAAACVVVSYVIYYQTEIRSWFSRKPLQASLGVFAIVLVVGAVGYADLSNLSYVFANIMSFASTALNQPSRMTALYTNVGVAALGLILASRKWVSPIVAYFCVLSVIVYAFFLITPDEFHFAKYVEYVVPMYVALFISADTYLRTHGWYAKLNVVVRPALMISTVILLVRGLQLATASPPYYQLRMVDSLGSPYFASRQVQINGRLIDANINEATVARLEAFPSSEPAAYLISPLDKYVEMLYDRHNGFDSVDFTAWLDNDGKMRSVAEKIMRKHASVVIDSQAITAHPDAGISDSNRILGTVNFPSVLNVESRIREAELTAILIAACRVSTPIDAFWLVVRC